MVLRYDFFESVESVGCSGIFFCLFGAEDGGVQV